MQIYKITNTVNGKIYVGKDEASRPYYMGSGLLLRRALKKYGKENFIKEILEECSDRKTLSDREQWWINHLQCQNPTIGYNISKGGDGGDTLSSHPDLDIIKDKISHKMKSRKLSSSHKSKLSARMKGNTFGKKNQGSHKTEEHKQKLRAKAQQQWNRQKEAGYTLKEEHKKILSEKAKARWAQKRASGIMDTEEYKNHMRELQKKSIAAKLNNNCNKRNNI